jgi:flavin reductase (DIM6/NTAB) family NADH-FMN oxidoreductase RutF
VDGQRQTVYTYPMSSTPSDFNRLMAELDYAMLIVTAAAGGERAGCLVGFATQVSIHPPRYLVCISDKNHTYRVAAGAEVLVVHFVPEQAEELAVLFGGETGDEVDKFAQVQWRPGPEGAPILDALEDWFAGRVLDRLEFGDHRGFLLEPIEGEAHRSGEPFRFHRAKWIQPGHRP